MVDVWPSLLLVCIFPSATGFMQHRLSAWGKAPNPHHTSTPATSEPRWPWTSAVVCHTHSRALGKRRPVACRLPGWLNKLPPGHNMAAIGHRYKCSNALTAWYLLGDIGIAVLHGTSWPARSQTTSQVQSVLDVPNAQGIADEISRGVETANKLFSRT